MLLPVFLGGVLTEYLAMPGLFLSVSDPLDRYNLRYFFPAGARFLPAFGNSSQENYVWQSDGFATSRQTHEGSGRTSPLHRPGRTEHDPTTMQRARMPRPR